MRDLKIRTRVLIGFSATLLLLLMVSFIGYHGSVQTKEKYDDLINRAMPAAVEVQNMNYNLAVIAASVRGYIAYGDDTHLNTLQKSKEQFHKNTENLLAMTQAEENQRLIKEIITASDEYEKIVDLSIDAGKNKDIAKAKNLSMQGRVYLQTAQEKSTQLKSNIDTIVRDTQKTTSEKSAQTNLLTLIFSTIAFVIGIILSIIIFRSIVSLTKEIITFIEHVAASSQQISASTEEIAHGSQQQAASASHSSELVKEMTSVIQSVAKNTEQAAIFSEKAVELSIDGNSVIQEAVTGMRDVRQKMDKLEKESQQIQEIIKVISQIADQTNLLALNAAIEAAHAGEAGNGFAVVAGEVRKLAERSRQETKEISALTQLIQQGIEDAVLSAKTGDEEAQNAGKSFEQIKTVVQELSGRVSEIAAATEEQAAQSSGVLGAVENIAAVTQQTAAGTEETAAAVVEMANMSEKLSHLINKL